MSRLDKIDQHITKSRLLKLWQKGKLVILPFKLFKLFGFKTKKHSYFLGLIKKGHHQDLPDNSSLLKKKRKIRR